MKNELQNQKHQVLWLSTAGDGVAWLHTRIDKNPKYYHFEEYKYSPKWINQNRVISSI